ncbi:MAG: mechanosensitive ion channel family protein [Anaerolineales bacterium]
MMNKPIVLTVMILLAIAAFFVASCSTPAYLEVFAPDTPPTETLAGTDAVSEAESGGDEQAPESGEEVIEAVASRTPVPTSTPGAIEIVVDNFTENVGIEDIIFLGLSSADWINLVISVLLALVLYRVGMWLIRTFLRRVVARTPTEFDDRFLEETDQQIRWLIIVFVIEKSLLRLQFLSVDFKSTIKDTTFTLYLLIFAVMSWKLVNFGLEHLEDRLSQRMDTSQVNTLMQLVGMLVKFVVVFIYFTILLDHFGISITALAAVIGIGGLALSLAAQDTIADFISGIIILLDQPFRIGDRIEVDAINTWGDVTEIGLRTTKIRTRDNRLVMIPNSTIGNSPVVNYTFPDPRYRIQIEVGIGYGQDIDEIRRVIKEAVGNINGVLKDKPVDALFLEFGETNMIFRIRWWIDSYVDTRRMFDTVNQALYTALEGAGVEMPFTTYDVNIKFDGGNAERMADTFNPDKKK